MLRLQLLLGNNAGKGDPCIFIAFRVQVFAYSYLTISGNCIRNREICVSYQLLKTLSNDWFLYSDIQSCPTQKAHISSCQLLLALAVWQA